jgi:hypothetical protein
MSNRKSLRDLTIFKLRTPIVDIHTQKFKNLMKPDIRFSINSGLFTNTPDILIDSVKSSNDAKIIGSLAVIFYFMSFLWIYGSSWFNYDITLTLKDSKGFTLSEAFDHSEKIGSTTLLVIMTSLLIGLLIEQGFIEGSQSVAYSELRYSLVIITFVILASFLLLFWVPISKKNIIQMSSHGFVAFLILFFALFSSYVYYTSYKEFIESDLVSSIEYLTYSICILILIIVISLFVGFSNPKWEKITSSFIAGAEIIYIIVYGVILSLFTQLPSISALNFEKICISN